jgi:hypothetical protein
MINHTRNRRWENLMLFPTLRLVAAALGLSGLLVATAVPAHAQLQLVLNVGGADRTLGGEGENL